MTLPMSLEWLGGTSLPDMTGLKGMEMSIAKVMILRLRSWIDRPRDLCRLEDRDRSCICRDEILGLYPIITIVRA